MVVAQHSTRLISVRIQEPLADQVIIADVPTTQPIRQFSGDAIEISDSENQGKKKNERRDPEVEALFGEGFFNIPAQERRQKIKDWRKEIGSQPSRPSLQ